MRTSVMTTLVGAVSIFIFSAGSALSGTYAPGEAYRFGTPPYTLNLDYYPQIETGCWKWNWQQHQWDDHCPAYVNPKAYMNPRSRPVVLRTRG